VYWGRGACVYISQYKKSMLVAVVMCVCSMNVYVLYVCVCLCGCVHEWAHVYYGAKNQSRWSVQFDCSAVWWLVDRNWLVRTCRFQQKPTIYCVWVPRHDGGFFGFPSFASDFWFGSTFSSIRTWKVPISLILGIVWKEWDFELTKPTGHTMSCQRGNVEHFCLRH
jgi:hypothetical protein